MSAAQSKVATTVNEVVDTRAVKKSSPLVRWLSSSGAWVLLLDIALIIIFTILSPRHVFFSLRNLESLLLNGSVTLLLALGVAMLLGAGAVDISVGANLVLSSVVGALVMIALKPMGAWVSIPLGLLACLAAGLLFGAMNGAIIAYLDVNSLIATLGTTGIGMAAAYLLTGGSDVGGLPHELQEQFGLNSIGPIPFPALIAIGMALIMWLVVRYTRYGMRTLAIGSSRLSAERAGIKIKRHLMSLTILTGVLAGLGGFITLGHYGATTVNGHANDALAAITAAVIGGTRLEGGKISIAGAIWGTALAVILQGGLVVIGVQSFWQLGAIGAVLIGAVILDRVQARRRVSR